MEREYTLEVAELPARQRTGIYETIVSEYINKVRDNPDQPVKSAKVTLAGRPVKTVQVGLAKAIQTTGHKDISVTVRLNEVYLAPKHHSR